MDRSRSRLTPVRRWQPLTDAEWAALCPFVIVQDRPGRPLKDARRRMDAIFWVAAAACPWRELPPRYGKPDTVSRHFRRFCHLGLWERLLKALSWPESPQALRDIAHWIVGACRRAARLCGLRIVVLARRLGFLSALRAPSHMLPKPDLSEMVDRWLRSAAEQAREHGVDRAMLAFLRFCHRLGRFAAGRRRLGRRFLPA